MNTNLYNICFYKCFHEYLTAVKPFENEPVTVRSGQVALKDTHLYISVFC